MNFTNNGIAILSGDLCISKWVKESGRLDHDQNMLPLILPHIKPGAIVLDIGAFIGDHTIAYSRAAGVDGLIFAFEPSVDAFECLSFNTKKLPNVTCFNQALGNDTGRVGIQKVNGNYGMNFLTKGNEISITTIDELAFWGVDFIKIDCEGYELEVLRGGLKTIKKFKPVLLIEINEVTLKRRNVKRDDIYRLLDSIGYSIENIYKDQGLDEIQIDIICHAT